MKVIDRKKIAKLMTIQDVSGRQMSQTVGWKSHTYLQRILRGEVRTANQQTAAKIADALDVNVEDLFEQQETS